MELGKGESKKMLELSICYVGCGKCFDEKTKNSSAQLNSYWEYVL
jgi:hypothetical protein